MNDKGDVYWIKFKEPDKRRPALIITRDTAIPLLNSVTVIPTTSSLRDNPSTVWLDESDGMPNPSLINVDLIQTVNKDRVGTYITHLTGQKIDEVFDAMKFAFGFDN